MNTLDDLRSSLDGYADRGDARGADAVLAGARIESPMTTPAVLPHHPSSARRSRLVAVAAAFLVLVATVALIRSRSDDLDVTTTPEPPVGSVPRALSPVAVADGTVRVVHVGFDRVWVGTGPDEVAPRLRSYDILTRELTSEIDLRGAPTAIAETDGALWVRIDAPPASGADEPNPPVDMTLARIDPVAGTVVAETPLRGDGPMAAHGRRLAVSDRTELMIVDDTLGTVATTSIAEVIGRDNTVPTDVGPEPAGLTALAFGSDVLTALYFGGLPGEPSTSRTTGELVTLDPATGRHESTRLLDPAQNFLPFLAHVGTTTWLTLDRDLVPVDDNMYSEPIGAVRSQQLPMDEFIVGLATFGDRVLVRTVSDAVVTGGGTTFRTPVDRLATTASVELDGLPWIAQWNQGDAGPGTTVSFVLVRTDADGPPGTFQVPTTQPSPPSTFASGGPTLWKIAEDPMRDGVAYPIVGAGLPPGDAFLRVCLDQPTAVGGDCWVPSSLPNPIVTVGGGGQLYTVWTAQRSVYDDRWHDCAVEACSLRLFPKNEAGGVDTGRVLAQTPLRFSADVPPIRPTIALDAQSPITVGTKGLINGEHFPPGTRGISVGACRTGDQDGSCTFDLAAGVNLMADEQGRFSVTYAARSTTITVPGADGAPDEMIDCTVAGACSLSVFLDESSREPYATVPLLFLG